jgi:hypothetical protein
MLKHWIGYNTLGTDGTIPLDNRLAVRNMVAQGFEHAPNGATCFTIISGRSLLQAKNVTIPYDLFEHEVQQFTGKKWEVVHATGSKTEAEGTLKTYHKEQPEFRARIITSRITWSLT